MPRRFIAGAICPRCGALDKLLVDSEQQRLECVSCSFTEARPLAVPDQPGTRVSRHSARRAETPAEAVRLFDNAAADKDEEKS